MSNNDLDPNIESFVKKLRRGDLISIDFDKSGLRKTYNTCYWPNKRFYYNQSAVSIASFNLMKNSKHDKDRFIINGIYIKNDNLEIKNAERYHCHNVPISSINRISKHDKISQHTLHLSERKEIIIFYEDCVVSPFNYLIKSSKFLAFAKTILVILDGIKNKAFDELIIDDFDLVKDYKILFYIKNGKLKIKIGCQYVTPGNMKKLCRKVIKLYG